MKPASDVVKCAECAGTGWVNDLGASAPSPVADVSTQQTAAMAEQTASGEPERPDRVFECEYDMEGGDERQPWPCWSCPYVLTGDLRKWPDIPQPVTVLADPAEVAERIAAKIEANTDTADGMDYYSGMKCAARIAREEGAK